MMGNSVNDILFALLRNSVCSVASNDSQSQPEIPPSTLPELYKLSKQHDMAHLMYSGLEKQEFLENSEIITKFRKQQMIAIYRYQQLEYELNRICQLLEEVQIPFIPLKGSVLRKYYPAPWMRTSCDIDILIHEEDLQTAIQSVTERLNYQLDQRYSHDYSLHSLNGVHFELHYSLMEDNRAGNSSPILLSVWEKSHLAENKRYHYVMSDEMFYFYHIAHMAKHFETGGCGVKPFLDLWILEHQIPHSDDPRNKLLEKGHLLTFANACRKLSNVWFSNDIHNQLTLALQEYILYGGTYGKTDNSIAVQQSQKGGKVKYIISRIFMPYDLLKNMYPTLQKQKWLLPFFHIRRWCRIIFKTGIKKAKYEMRASQNLSQDKKTQVANLLSQLEL